MQANPTLDRVSAPIGASQRRRAIVATVIGNGLEWFDFTVYSFFAVIIARLFFPTGDELSSLLLAVATFGVGFFMRPVGGIIIGIYADRVGRKAALSLTILLMAVGTTLIGIAPTYDQVGLFAPMLIVLARLLQGFSAGGEMGGATAFLTEYAPERERAYYSSWIQASIGVAVLLGAAVGTFVTSSLPPEALNSWGWRLPFLIGMLIGPVGYYIRHHLDETPTFQQTKDKTDSPLKEVLRDYPRQTAASFSMVILWTVCTYVLLFYMPTYAVKVLKVPQSSGFVAGMVGGMAILVFAPLVGRLADRFGRRILLSGSAALIFVLAWPMYVFINQVPGLFSLLVFQLVFGVLIAGYTGPILAAFSELFPAKVLSTGLSVAYNLAVTIFGGFASFIITWLIATTGSTMAPAFYVMIAAAISFAGTLLVREPAYLRKA
ncbi:MFS transporter [Cupriavidus oxalaticus]|jgi:MHS family proline/betaine transporter-like MFS transporter|uniref:General substrate transporter:Major facilitator superfamily MFS_1 n=1 Tax=Cupriavidus oxalaticus TaxID=96344 RepID=A0A375FUN2_9BURK|nr:MFS transporter [Cupriavidus oxalaticus]QRQ83869.1 MFS transporter [Cupriavidus oxalaticus]QRQ92042.1 MFS transporter [Cupriavidus oxalaticus]WQD86640.1 MFS transporter [Cupriavidus oxalaticus]SPC10485.1 General substrate transporter:Major facilitator superfamily MFS_1 [Cupriavidus oxalaticus]SPC19360.1 General substrate transporter:Major facilitator superfamily MFS_1 [Cupriavidus oxalaticus]